MRSVLALWVTPPLVNRWDGPADGVGRAAGGVMLSESTARLVEGAAELADPQLVRIKGAEDAVPARGY